MLTNSNTQPRLSSTHLPTDAKVQLPQYVPDAHGSDLVHLGIGAFHRAHQAVYTEEVLNQFGGDWRISAVSLRNTKVRDQLCPQECWYSLTEKSENATSLRVIAAIKHVLVAPECPAAVIALLAQKNLKVITMTITEKGYCQKQGTIDLSHPQIFQDLAQPHAPQTMPGFIVAACRERQQKAYSGFSIISCDNLVNNGDITRRVVLGFARAVDPQLAEWIACHVTFCSSMVDCIVPATRAQDIEYAADKLGVVDRGAVVSEPQRYWVIQNNFCTQRPAWEKVGAKIVDDIAPYEMMKLRLLNGSHSLLAYLGFLCGYEYIHQAISDKNLHKLVCVFMDNEVSPTLNVPDLFDVAAYKKDICTRFLNASLPYKTLQVASDGSQKIPQRILGTAKDALTQNSAIEIIALVIAAWFRFLEAKDLRGMAMDINDPLAQGLTEAARAHPDDSREQVIQLMGVSEIFPNELMTHQGFIESIIHALTRIHKVGARDTIRDMAENLPGALKE